MEGSTLVASIQRSDVLRTRIEALVRAAWRDDDEADPTAPIPLDDLAWAVATNPTVRATVTAQQAIDSGNNALPLGIANVTDDDLSYIVLTVALPRLQGTSSR